MIVSRCCKKQVWVYHGNEGTSFYVCDNCTLPCDTINPSYQTKDSPNVARNDE